MTTIIETIDTLIEAAKQGELGAKSEQDYCYHSDDKYCSIGFLLTPDQHKQIDELGVNSGTGIACLMQDTIYSPEENKELMFELSNSLTNRLAEFDIDPNRATELQCIHDQSFNNNDAMQVDIFIAAMEEFKEEVLAFIK